MKRRTQRGFLLIEVIFAVALMAIGLFVIMAGLSQCLAAARKIQSNAIVQTLLANKAYEFRVERAQDYLEQNGRFDDYPGYNWSRTFEQTDVEHLWLQKITIVWNERGYDNQESVVEYRYLPDK